MFGEHRRNRKIRRENKRRESQRMFEDAERAGEMDTTNDYNQLRQQSSNILNAERGARDARRQQHMEQSKREMTQDMPGLTNQQRQALQDHASTQLARDMDNYNRQILSSAGERGMRGGIVSAQQRDLMRKGMEARMGFESELAGKDIDAQMQRLAGTLVSTEGKVAQDIAEQQKAQDWLEAKKQERRQQAMGRMRQNDYSRV